MKYRINPTGSRPYRTSVMMAPRMEPLVAVASATLIMTATYSQAMGMMYISARGIYHMSGNRREYAEILGLTRRPTIKKVTV